MTSPPIHTAEGLPLLLWTRLLKRHLDEIFGGRSLCPVHWHAILFWIEPNQITRADQRCSRKNGQVPFGTADFGDATTHDYGTNNHDQFSEVILWAIGLFAEDIRRPRYISWVYL